MTVAPGHAIPDPYDDRQAPDPEWYKRAVFYEVLVGSFFDSTADGKGDLPGLAQKLDYLQWLGVDCLWLPPVFPSPLRDGGYDVADFTDVRADAGTIGDFVQLVDHAHARGLRVIIDFVMNHTSDQHPWFQASRSDPTGPFGDFYVWSDTDTRYADARIIFIDTETSNWTFDPVRRQYFWHRFFSHQPDLNYENPAVQDAIMEALRFWLDLGIDGFRLDAVPYLFEEDGTNCENLPQTHAFLKRVRTEVDRLFPNRVLLAEANQWPSDVVDYLGDPATGGDECHMAFHFPVPRIEVPDLGDPGRDAQDPEPLPVGHLPAQPRRADARDGQRRGTRLHVHRVRQGPTYAGQHRDPPSPGHVARERPSPDRAVQRVAALAPRVAGPLLRRRDRHGRQHLAR